jgi:hypothetical protein
VKVDEVFHPPTTPVLQQGPSGRGFALFPIAKNKNLNAHVHGQSPSKRKGAHCGLPFYFIGFLGVSQQVVFKNTTKGDLKSPCRKCFANEKSSMFHVIFSLSLSPCVFGCSSACQKPLT